MIGISKLYCGQVEPSDALRYGRHSSQLPSHLLQFSEDKKPEHAPPLQPQVRALLRSGRRS